MMESVEIVVIWNDRDGERKAVGGGWWVVGIGGR